MAMSKNGVAFFMEDNIPTLNYIYPLVNMMVFDIIF